MANWGEETFTVARQQSPASQSLIPPVLSEETEEQAWAFTPPGTPLSHMPIKGGHTGKYGHVSFNDMNIF